MYTMAELPSNSFEEAVITYAKRAIDLELFVVQIKYAPTGGLSESDYDSFGLKGWANLAPPPAPPNTSWFHEKTEQPPAQFRYGPLAGTQQELAAKIFPGKRIDTRRLQRKAEKRASIWVRKTHRTHYEVWFRHEADYLKVKGHTQA